MDKRAHDAFVNSVAVVAETNGSKAKAQLERNKKVEAEKSYRAVLTEFMKGLEYIEAQLKTKSFSDISGLGRGLDIYFAMGTDPTSTDSKMHIQHKAMKQWLLDHEKKE